MVYHTCIKANLSPRPPRQCRTPVVRRKASDPSTGSKAKPPSPLRRTVHLHNRAHTPAQATQHTHPAGVTETTSLHALVWASLHVQHAYTGGSLATGLDMLADLACGSCKPEEKKQSDDPVVKPKIIIRISAEAVARASASPSPPRVKLNFH